MFTQLEERTRSLLPEGDRSTRSVRLESDAFDSLSKVALQVKTIVSLNPVMVDGTGMCGGCRVIVGGKVKFACVDGPEFDAHQVDFAVLAARQSTYKTHEQQADHACKVGLGV